MNIESYAPILVVVYDRFNHFKRCVGSLQKCRGAEHTELFIALDYPKHESGLDAFRQIHSYAMSLDGFKNVTVLERTTNLGPEKNYKDAKNYIEQKHDRIILTENDNEFSISFLEYINKGLDKFQDNPRIIAVCGDGGSLKNLKTMIAITYSGKGFQLGDMELGRIDLGKLNMVFKRCWAL